MTAALRLLCALAVFCGALLSVMPEGSVKRIAAIGCTAAMLLAVLGALRELDPGDFTLELARYRELGRELAVRSEEVRDRLNRSVIEEEYEAYICDEAKRFGADGIRAEVTLRWDMAGVWLPYEVRLSGRADRDAVARLRERIGAELGVPPERISWDDEERG